VTEALFAAFAVPIAIIDIKKFRIPDLLIAALGVSLIIYDIVFAPKIIGEHVLAAVIAFGLFLAVYVLRGGLGFGDVKYAAVIGYYTGCARLMPALLAACVLGVLYWSAAVMVKGRKDGRRLRIPFAPCLAAGALAAAFIPAEVFRGIA
jgi:prepilin signal peptidase PulO-like enzyme (type II secretory pathway)